ncbi:MAG: hypothetical protein ACWIPH_09770 [Ostreibacterium sp.]
MSNRTQTNVFINLDGLVVKNHPYRQLDGLIDFHVLARPLQALYSEKVSEGIMQNFRRLQSQQQYHCERNNMLMSIDVDLDLHGEDACRQIHNMDGYYARSIENTIKYINSLNEISSINRYVLRLTKSSILDSFEKINYFVASIHEILEKIINKNEIIIDPFGLALDEQLRWGIFDSQGFNLNETEKCLYNFCNESSKLGIAGILTLGRIATEVEVTKQAIQDSGCTTKICSFSSNQETSSAYIYHQSSERIYDTGQKIQIANILDMDLWSLIDIWCGTDISVIKPLENYAMITRIYTYITDRQKREIFLNSDAVQKAVENNRHAQRYINEMRTNYDDLTVCCEKIKIGVYTDRVGLSFYNC